MSTEPKGQIKSFVTLVAPSAIIGGVLLQQAQKEFGWAFLIVAIILFIVVLLSYLIPGLVKLLNILSRPIVWVYLGLIWVSRKLLMIAKMAIYKIFDFFIGRYIEERISATEKNWVAQKPVLYPKQQRADFLRITTPEGKRLRGFEFNLRPDYQFDYWRAGFKLTTHDENLRETPIATPFLFHLWQNAQVDQTQYKFFHNGHERQTFGLRHLGRPWPTILVRVNISKIRNNNNVRVLLMVDNSDAHPIVTQITSQQAEELILMAWGDGRDFRVFFDDIKVFYEEVSK